jgi:hypothetical protein
MPFPVLVGLPWLASVISGFFGTIFSFFAQHLTKKILVIASVIALVVTATIGMITTLESLLSIIVYTLPDFQYVGLILPSNFTSCVSACLTARVTYWVYSWNTKIIQYKLDL